MSAANSRPNTGPGGRLILRARAQITMLTIMFLLGMAVNLIGMPSEVSGAAKTATSIFLGLHVLVSLGLLVGAGLTIRLASAAGDNLRRLAWIGGVLIVLTFLAGVLTLAFDNNWWSYLMAAGFIASYLVYIGLFIQARAPTIG